MLLIDSWNSSISIDGSRGRRGGSGIGFTRNERRERQRRACIDAEVVEIYHGFLTCICRFVVCAKYKLYF